MILRNSAEMTAEEMQPLWPDIVRCLAKYCARFPDETVEHVIQECAQGRRQLWLFMDEGAVHLVVVTEIVTINATGRKRLIIAEAGGTRIMECLPFILDIEEWAKTQGANEPAHVIGRKGWTRLLAAYGYGPKAVIFEKRL